MTAPEETEHTDLCTRIHDLLMESIDGAHKAKTGSLTRERLLAVADSLSGAEEAAHGACGTGV